MGYLIMGIILFVLPILTWFGLGFVEATIATLFFWIIGIPMILVGTDKMKLEGIWAVKKEPNLKPLKGHDARVYHFDDNGKIIGHKDVWTKD